VLAADVDPFAVAATALNAELNALDVEVSGEDLLAAPDRDELCHFAVVLIGDLFYERELADRVLVFIDRMAAAGAHVLVGDPGRSYFPVARFEKVAEYGVPVTRELEDSEIKQTAVWRYR
jgi:predicted nicotinamide N-methyase